MVRGEGGVKVRCWVVTGVGIPTPVQLVSWLGSKWSKQRLKKKNVQKYVELAIFATFFI